MRLQKQLSQKRGLKVYYKYSVVLPTELVEKLRWSEGVELDYESRGSNLILKPATH